MGSPEDTGRQVGSTTDQLGGLRLPIPLQNLAALNGVVGPCYRELLAPRPKRLYVTQKKTLFWDWTFLTPDGEGTALGTDSPAGTPKLPVVFQTTSLHSCLKTAPKVELFHLENIAPTAYHLLDTNDEDLFFVY